MTYPYQILFIVGPTAVGKSRVAHEAAMRISGEIVSLDAMNVYKEINIASDKPSMQMQQQIPYYAINIVSVVEDFDVARYQKHAVDSIFDIVKRQKIPVVVGGSGMYMAILLDGIFNQPAVELDVRQQLLDEISQDGTVKLHERLMAMDPAAAQKIHPHDAKRIVRALEVLMSTGKPISAWQKEREGLWGKYSIKIVGLNRPRAQLYDRINERVLRMFEGGLVDEVKALASMSLGRSAATLIGIPEVMGYIKGEYDLERAKYLLQRNSRHLAKRQLTWFRRDERISWIETESEFDLEQIVQ